MFKESNCIFYKTKGKKFINDKGINFNLPGGTPFLNRKSFSRDTISETKFRDFPLTKEGNLEEKEKNGEMRNMNF